MARRRFILARRRAPPDRFLGQCEAGFDLYDVKEMRIAVQDRHRQAKAMAAVSDASRQQVRPELGGDGTR